MRIKILSPAEDDLVEAYRFYESPSEGLGTYFMDTLYSDIDALAYYSGMHLVVLGYHRQPSKQFPFAVYYRVVDDTVLVTPFLIAAIIQVG
jgi:hypothetical protein